MFLKMRKSDKSETVQSDDVPEVEQSNAKVDQEEDVLVNQTTNLEDTVNKKTRKTEDAGQPLDGLSETKDSKEEDDTEVRTKAVPAQILDLDTEPAVEPAEEPPDRDKNLNITLENAEPESTGETGMLSDIFSDEDEAVNPLQGLIDSLPDITAEELLQEVQAITTMMHENTSNIKTGKWCKV